MATNIVELKTATSTTEIDDLLDRVTITSPEGIHGAAEAFAKVAEARGMRIAVCSDISSKEPMVDAEGTVLAADVFGWLADGERWWDDHRLALNSPLPRACRYESEAFWANRDGFYTRWPNSYLDEIDLVDFEKRALCRASIIVPTHLPFGQIAATGFTSLDREKDDLSAEFEAYSTLFAQLSHRFVAGYVQANRTKRRIPSDCVLSKREVECLRWAAIGKTDREISMILERSHATIRYHIHRAGEKLDSVNRAQTIFKAGQLGYLGASD